MRIQLLTHLSLIARSFICRKTSWVYLPQLLSVSGLTRTRSVALADSRVGPCPRLRVGKRIT